MSNVSAKLFINNLIKKLNKNYSIYGFSAIEFQCLNFELGQIQKRVNEKTLYLGVVGEFSSGKSTFINALIGVDLLKEDVLSGTTCAPTLICYGDKFEVNVILKNSRKSIIFNGDSSITSGKEKSISFLQKDLNLARNMIHTYTAKESESTKVEKVIIKLPIKNPIFSNNIAIVDTPGINSDNPRHQEVTVEAIKNLCDLAIVLTPATAPCSESFLSFVKNNLYSFVEHSICLISQIDRLRERERDRQITYISSRLNKEGLAFLHVLPISAYNALCQNCENSSKNIYFNDFKKVISIIAEAINDNKAKILDKKIKGIIDYILDCKIQPVLKGKQEEYKTRLNELQTNQLIDFDGYIERKICKLDAEMQKKREEAINFVCLAISEAFKEAKHEICNQIVCSNTIVDLTNVMGKENFEKIVSSKYSFYVERERLNNEDAFKKALIVKLKEIKDDFNENFRNLAKNKKKTSIDTNVNLSYSLNVLKNVSIDENTVDTSVATFTGVGIGAFIGTMIVPGLGTIIGGIMGKFVSKFIPPSQDQFRQAKRTTEDILSKNEKNILNLIINEVNSCFDSLMNLAVKDIKSLIRYRTKIYEIKKEEEMMLNEILQKIQTIEKDLKSIEIGRTILMNKNL